MTSLKIFLLPRASFPQKKDSYNFVGDANTQKTFHRYRYTSYKMHMYSIHVYIPPKNLLKATSRMKNRFWEIENARGRK